MSATVKYKNNTIATINNETKKLLTSGTWMEDDIEITDVDSFVELETENGYIILDDDPIAKSLHVLSTSDSGAELLPGYYYIPNGYEGFFSGIYATSPILTQSWDLTQSLEDTVSGTTITLSGATQSSTGLTLSAANHYATIPVKYRPYKSYEFDISSMTPSTGTTHGRFIMMTPTEGFIYRSGSSWCTYMNGGWAINGPSDGSAFAGHTLTMVVKNGAPKFYLDGVLWYTSTRTQDLQGSYDIMIGSSQQQSYYNITITAIRIYDGVKYDG